MLSLAQNLKNYVATFSTAEDPVLEELHRRTRWETVNPQMISGALQGKFLEFISRMISPQRILEVGTFTGYSAICLARGLKENGKLITIEANDELRVLILEFFKKAQVSDKTELIIGNALQIIPMLKESFDLVFIDAEKTEYLPYFEQIIEKVKPGGFLLADNVLWDGKVVDPPKEMDADTAGIHAFNTTVKNDPRVEQVILPFRDGLMLMRKK